MIELILNFDQIESRETGIEMEIQRFLVAWLAITKTGKLICIPEDKLDLKSCFVVAINFDGIQGQIGWKK